MRTNGRFAMALHILTVLAYKDGDYVSSDLLSASVNTNPVIIRRLLLALQEAKLVETRKGPGAGSRLARSSSRINLAEVYRAIEGCETFGLPKKRPNGHCPVGHSIRSALKLVFASAQHALERQLATISLAGIVENIKAGQPPLSARN